MQRKVTLVIPAFLLAAVFIISGCCPSCTIDEPYRVPEGHRYHCEGFGIVEARYYSLAGSDDHFVHLVLPDGKEHTLPQAVSASGARYTDDERMLWWIKGESAILKVRDDQGEWRSVSENCRAGNP